MNIAKIGIHSAAFGIIKRSAAEKAANDAGGRQKELQRINDCIEKNKNNNRYDVEEADLSRIRYSVSRRGSNKFEYFADFFDACDYAEFSDEYDAYFERLASGTKSQL